MRLNPKKIEHLARCLRACFNDQEFSANDILRLFAAAPLKKDSKNQQLKAAVRALIGGRLTKQRLGNLLSKDITDGVAWLSDEVNLKIEARYDREAEAWRYRVTPIKTDAELAAEARQLLAGIHKQAEAFEDQLAVMPVDRAVRRALKAKKELQKNLDRTAEEELEATEERREHDAALREYERARQEHDALAVALQGSYSQRHGWQDRQRLRGDELAARARLEAARLRLETSKLRESEHYQRIAAEIRKTPHKLTDQIIRQIRAIELMRGAGWHWRAGMSINVGDHKSFSLIERGVGLFGSDRPSTMRDSFTTRNEWSPFEI